MADREGTLLERVTKVFGFAKTIHVTACVRQSRSRVTMTVGSVGGENTAWLNNGANGWVCRIPMAVALALSNC